MQNLPLCGALLYAFNRTSVELKCELNGTVAACATRF